VGKQKNVKKTTKNKKQGQRAKKRVYVAFTLNGFHDQERKLSIAKTVF